MRRLTRIMMPLDNDRLGKHFGRCDVFAYVMVDEDAKTVLRYTKVFPPRHYPGLIPHWVMEEGADLVIAGGMGRRAQQLLATLGIEVVVGVREKRPITAVSRYLRRELATGSNPCEHCEYSSVAVATAPQTVGSNSQDSSKLPSHQYPMNDRLAG